MVKLLLNYTYELESDEPVENVELRPQLSKELSRQVRSQCTSFLS